MCCYIQYMDSLHSNKMRGKALRLVLQRFTWPNHTKGSNNGSNIVVISLKCSNVFFIASEFL